jgi:hypothetical protein
MASIAMLHYERVSNHLEMKACLVHIVGFKMFKLACNTELQPPFKAWGNVLDLVIFRTDKGFLILDRGSELFVHEEVFGNVS